MPRKGVGIAITLGKRFNPLTRAFVKEFRKKTGIKITYEEYCDIIWDGCKKMQDGVADGDAGLEIPERMGHLVVTKYKSSKIYKDWKNQKQVKKEVPHLNLHSFGYVFHIKWFKAGSRLQNGYIYKLQPCREFTRHVGNNIKAGKRYAQWESTDFWATTAMERMFEKSYQKRKHLYNDNSEQQ